MNPNPHTLFALEGLFYASCIIVLIFRRIFSSRVSGSSVTRIRSKREYDAAEGKNNENILSLLSVPGITSSHGRYNYRGAEHGRNYRRTDCKSNFLFPRGTTERARRHARDSLCCLNIYVGKCGIKNIYLELSNQRECGRSRSGPDHDISVPVTLKKQRY